MPREQGVEGVEACVGEIWGGGIGWGKGVVGVEKGGGVGWCVSFGCGWGDWGFGGVLGCVYIRIQAHIYIYPPIHLPNSCVP